MNVYQMSMVAVMGLCMTVLGVSKITGDSVYPFIIGFALFGAALVHAVRSLQKQIDKLKSEAQPPATEDSDAPTA